MTINDLTTKQITAALKFVTGQPPGRFADHAAGVKRLQREMGAHGVKPQEVMAALGLDDPEQNTAAESPADVALRERAERDRREQDSWTAQQREHDDAANADVRRRCAQRYRTALHERADEREMERRARIGAEEMPAGPEWVECTERAFTKAAKAAAKARGTSVQFKTVVQAEFGDGDAAEWIASPDGSSGTWASALFAAKPKQPRKPAGERQPRGPGRLEQVVELLKREGGATLPQVCEETGWLPHTARAFITSRIGKKGGYDVISERPAGAKDRVYRIEREAA